MGRVEGNVKVRRLKNWSEINDKQKIKRLRETVKRLENRTNSLWACVQQLKRHKHLPDGTVVVELGNGYDSSTLQATEADDEVYF